MSGGREVMMLLIGWIMQIGFMGAILFAVYRINDLHKQMEELRDDLRMVRNRLENMPPAQ